ncbi:MAG: hypothetical protein GX811_01105 [Lentisphaerae bacterium]|nr:hypothetical protein [Lentisphaerota bacterium]
MIDTLHRPWLCGGPAVCFEAWEKGVELISQAQMASHLEQINHTLLLRRIGFMFEHLKTSIKDAEP